MFILFDAVAVKVHAIVFYFYLAQQFQLSCIFWESLQCRAESTKIYPLQGICRVFVNTSLGCNWWMYSNSLRFEKILGYLHNWKKKTYECSTSTCVLSVTSKPVICCHICRSLTERFLSAKDCTEAASSNFNPDSCSSLCCLLQLPTFYPPHITWDNMLLVTKYSCNNDQL